MKKTFYTFYYLQNPKTESIGYVGMTTEPLSRRLSKHISEAMRRNHSPDSLKNDWIRDILDQGVRPYIMQLEVSGFADALEAGAREKYWINTMKEKGYELTNMTEGGLGTPGLVLEVSEETKAKISGTMVTVNPQMITEGVMMRTNGDSWKTIYESWGMSRTNFYKTYKEKIDYIANSGLLNN